MISRKHTTRSLQCYLWKGMAWSICLCYCISLQAQGTRDAFLKEYYSLTEGEDVTEDSLVDATVERLLNINTKLGGTYDSLVTPLVIWHYNRLQSTLSMEDCLSFLDKNRVVVEAVHDAHPQDLARFYALYVPLYRYWYQSDSVSHYLDVVEGYLSHTTDPSDIRITWLYDKGRYAIDQSDYEASLTFFRRALEYLDSYFPDKLRFKYLLVNAIGIGYRRTGQAEAAIAHYESILQHNANDAASVGMTGAIRNNLGLAYKDEKRYAQAIQEMQAAIHYYAAHFSPAFPDIGSGYDNIALCYRELGSTDSALYYSQRALDFMRQNLGPHHPDLLLPMTTMTLTYIDAGRLAEALSTNATAQRMLKDLGWSPGDPSGAYFILDAFGVFASCEKIHRMLYERSGDTTHLSAAIEMGGYFIELTDYAYDNLKNDVSKEIFQKNYAPVFSAFVDDLYTMYQVTHAPALLETAFMYTEKFKSLELLYAAQKDKVDKISAYQELNTQYAVQVDSILFYENLCATQSDDPSRSTEAISKLNKFKEALYLWKERTRQSYPDYYQIIYHPNPLTIEDMQQALEGSDQCILSYHLGDSAVYLFVITQDHTAFIKQPFQDDMPELIAEFRHAIYAYFSQRPHSESTYVAEAEAYAQKARTLYGLLIEPAKMYLTPRVVIVVDKALGYLPFDLLLTSAPEVAYQFRDHAYLLRKYAISYSYSAKLWMDMRSREVRGGQRMLALAPDFPENPNTLAGFAGTRSALDKLYFNESEVRAINHIIPGRVLIGSDASREQFIRYSPEYAILHLATHSKANDAQGDFAFLAFTDRGDGNDKLLASEIYNLKLNAELVALSACETGLGELKSGEGIISLARAFAFAGARSIVSTLWSVNDQSTPAVMTEFYRNIHAGMTKDVALQQAKLAYVNTHGHADAHPFYWGGFTCAGDMRPIRMQGSKHRWWKWVIAVTVVFGLGLLLLRSSSGRE